MKIQFLKTIHKQYLSKIIQKNPQSTKEVTQPNLTEKRRRHRPPL